MQTYSNNMIHVQLLCARTTCSRMCVGRPRKTTDENARAAGHLKGLVPLGEFGASTALRRTAFGGKLLGIGFLGRIGVEWQVITTSSCLGGCLSPNPPKR